MEELFYQMEQRKRELEEAIDYAERVIKNSPPGKLRVSASHGCNQYIQILESCDMRYLGKKQEDIAKQLANKDYAKQFIQVATKEWRLLYNYLKKYVCENPEKVYTNLVEARKKLVSPILVSDDLFTKNWLEESFTPNPFHTEECIYETKRGDLVRSKSEAFIADIYYDLNIPYRYEAPVYLKDGSVKYPDFTILKTANRQIIYHEHLGLLDDSGYRRDNFKKLATYVENGIYLGKNLILTFEAIGCPFNAKQIKKMIREIVLEL